MGRWLRVLQAMPRPERAMLVRLKFALPLMSLSLRMFGYRRTLHLVERWSARPPEHAPRSSPVLAERLAQLAAIAGAHGPMKASCLRQALLVYGVLRRRGLQPQLRLGVRREGSGIGAHAWVELDGIPLAQPGLDHQPFASTSGSK